MLLMAHGLDVCCGKGVAGSVGRIGNLSQRKRAKINDSTGNLCD